MTPPQTLLAGRYRLLEPIGQGGMGRVWLAMDEFLTRQVAVKEVVAPQGLTGAEVRDMGSRALREARAAARLSHPNVVTVYDIVVTDTAPWIVMEYLPCRSLYEVVSEDGPVPVAEAARVGLAVLSALRAAHSVGVLHRDVKPGNVLMDEGGRIVLTDFGLATIVGDPSVTRSGMIIGSPSYMAPERARDAEAGEAADFWSLGATLYFAVEGRSPYERSTALATVAALASEDPDPAVRSGRLKPVLGGLLRRDPAARLDPATLERMLRSVARGAAKAGVAKAVALPVAAAPTPTATPTPVEAVPSVSATAVQPALADAHPEAGGEAARPWLARIDELAATASEVWHRTRTNASELWLRTRADRRSWAIGAAALLVLLALAAWAVAGSGTSDPPGPAEPAGPVAEADPTATATSTSTATSTGASQSAPAPTTSQPRATAVASSTLALPPGWRIYSDPTGFSVAVDASWAVTRQGTIVYFREANGGRVLGIDQTNTPAPDPVADWRGKEQYRVSRGDFPDYKQVRLVEVAYFQKAADWEFTYTQSGLPVHVNNRGFIVSPTRAYGMWWSTPADKWDEYRADLELIQRSFKPGA